MDAAILARFEKVRAQLTNDQPGIAAAAKNRWDAMVAKYGDPDEARSGGNMGRSDTNTVFVDDFGAFSTNFAGDAFSHFMAAMAATRRAPNVDDIRRDIIRRNARSRKIELAALAFRQRGATVTSENGRWMVARLANVQFFDGDGLIAAARDLGR